MSDRYKNFDQLNKENDLNKDYEIKLCHRPSSKIIIMAPHGGLIELGTSEIAEIIAGDDLNLYTFKGIKERKNFDLHITSSNFDEPKCLYLVKKCEIAVTIHGCAGVKPGIYLGGEDTLLIKLLENELQQDFYVKSKGHKWNGLGKSNICNRTSRNRGAQIEITRDLRNDENKRNKIANGIRKVLLFLDEVKNNMLEDLLNTEYNWRTLKAIAKDNNITEKEAKKILESFFKVKFNSDETLVRLPG